MVASLLAMVGGAIIFSLGNAREGVSEDLSDYEIRTIHDSIRKFKRDTGFYPKQGPFALTSNGGVIDPANASHWPAFLASASTAERTNWFNHPANFYQLIMADSPLQSTGHALESFNRQTGRGWRGPYIKDGVVRFVVGDAEEFDVTADAHTPANWTTSSWAGTGTPLVTDLVLLCDPFVGDTSAFPIREFGDEDPTSGLHGTAISDFGRPYTYFISGTSIWLVGMGKDRQYQGGSATSDDQLVYLVE